MRHNNIRPSRHDASTVRPHCDTPSLPCAAAHRLQALPPTIGGLSCLTGLFVGHNQLQQLPGCISMLQALHTLHAGEEA